MEDLTNEQFLQFLFEPLTTSFGAEEEYDSDILFRAILGNGFSNNVLKETTGISYIQPQLTGTCVSSSMPCLCQGKF